MRSKVHRFPWWLPILVFRCLLWIWLGWISWYIVDYDRSGAGTVLPIPWDAAYFHRIATVGGYEFEHMVAFFPGMPAVSRAVALPMWYVFGSHVSSWPEWVALAGYLVSNVAFALSVWEFWKLSLALGMPRPKAAAATFWYGINPAAIFMTVFYSESLFAYISLLSLRLAAEQRWWSSMAAIVLSGSVRSNGFVLVGIWAWQFIADRGGSLRSFSFVGLAAVLAVLPMVLFQLFAQAHFCDASATPVGQCAEYCRYPWLPSIYAHVQSQYWNVGFLRYFSPKQLPNFLLATPMLTLSALASWAGLRSSVFRPYAVLLALLAMLAFTTMHVQVSTRFLAAQPLLYWYVEGLPESLKKAVFLFFVLFHILGAVIHINGLPWT